MVPIVEAGRGVEQEKIAVILSPNFSDYARRYLHDCIQSLRQQDWEGGLKIFITDNQSTDESYAFMRRTAPEAEIVRNDRNDGFAKGNNDALRLALQQGFKYLVLFNMDTLIEKGCIRQLVKAANSDDRIGAVQARLMFWNDKERINSLGNVTHFLGFGYCKGYGDKWCNNIGEDYTEISYPSGAATLFKRKILTTVGLFDETFWMYNEDQDLGWRIWLAGCKCIVSPQAIVYHKFDVHRRIQNYYWLDRNRIIFMLKNYQWSTLLFISPALLIMDLCLFIYAFANGLFWDKLRVIGYFLRPTSWRYILRERKSIQASRRLADRELLELINASICYPEMDGWPFTLANSFFQCYWRFVKRFIRHIG